jgi:hypothetical protein
MGRSLLAAGVVWLVVRGVLLLLVGTDATLLGLQDFTIYWKAGRLFLEGANPYDPPHLLEYVEPGGLGFIDAQEEIIKMWSPPLILPILALFACVPLWVAKEAYVLGLTFALLYAVDAACTRLRSSGVSILQSAGILLLGTPYGAFLATLQWGGMSWLALLVVLLLLQTLARRRPFLFGVLLPLLVVKPVTMLIFAVCAACLGLRLSARRCCLGGVASVATLVVVTLVINPSSTLDYLALDMGLIDLYWQNTETFGALIFHLGLVSNVKLLQWGPCVLGAVGLGLTCARRGIAPSDRADLLLMIVPVSLFLAPYAWWHDYVVCTPFYLEVARRAVGAAGPVQRTVGVLGLGFFQLSFVWWTGQFHQGGGNYWIGALSALMVGYCAAVRPGGRAEGGSNPMTPAGRRGHTRQSPRMTRSASA